MSQSAKYEEDSCARLRCCSVTSWKACWNLGNRQMTSDIVAMHLLRLTYRRLNVHVNYLLPVRRARVIGERAALHEARCSGKCLSKCPHGVGRDYSNDLVSIAHHPFLWTRIERTCEEWDRRCDRTTPSPSEGDRFACPEDCVNHRAQLLSCTTCRLSTHNACQRYLRV